MGETRDDGILVVRNSSADLDSDEAGLTTPTTPFVCSFSLSASRHLEAFNHVHIIRTAQRIRFCDH